MQSVSIQGYRKYFEFIIDDEYKDNPEMINNTFKEIENLKLQGNFVIVRNRLKDAPINLESQSSITIIDEVEEGDFQLRGISSTMDLSDQMKKYLEIEQIPESDWEEYMSIGLSALESAKDVVYDTWVQDSSIGTDKVIISSTAEIQNNSSDEWAF